MSNTVIDGSSRIMRNYHVRFQREGASVMGPLYSTKENILISYQLFCHLLFTAISQLFIRHCDSLNARFYRHRIRPILD